MLVWLHIKPHTVEYPPLWNDKLEWVKDADVACIAALVPTASH
jgi:hypothetical protein